MGGQILGYDNMIGETHDMVVGKAGTANSLHDIHSVVKSNIGAGGDMSNVSLKSKPMRNLHDILMSSDKDSQKTNLSSPDGDDNVPNILSDM